MSGECEKCGEHALECVCGSPWISVKDRLPPAYDYVLVYAGNSIPCPIGIARNDETAWQPLDSFIGACFGDVSFEYDSEDITHWMPLPNPPKSNDG